MIAVTIVWMIALGFMLCMRADETKINKSVYLKHWCADCVVIVCLYMSSFIGIKTTAVLTLICFIGQYGRNK